MAYFEIEHDVDPKDKLLSEFKDLSGIEVFNNYVLVAVYQRPEAKTKGGVIISSKTVEEDQYQSKVGLIVSMGPLAFKDPDGLWFQGVEMKMHDWVVLPAAAAKSMLVQGVLCRLLKDEHITMRVPHPDDVY